jgi:hypothetical protein
VAVGGWVVQKISDGVKFQFELVTQHNETKRKTQSKIRCRQETPIIAIVGVNISQQRHINQFDQQHRKDSTLLWLWNWNTSDILYLFERENLKEYFEKFELKNWNGNWNWNKLNDIHYVAFMKRRRLKFVYFESCRKSMTHSSAMKWNSSKFVKRSRNLRWEIPICWLTPFASSLIDFKLVNNVIFSKSWEKISWQYE